VSKHLTNSNETALPQVIEKSRKRIGNLDFDRASHCVYHLAAHVVLCVKFHHRILTAERRDFANTTLRSIAETVDCEIIEFGAEDDHVHFLLRYPPTVKLSEVIGALKSKSAKALLDKFGSFFWSEHSRTVWSSGFFLCSVGGATLEILKQYIDNQGTR
jgi:putative transposase